MGSDRHQLCFVDGFELSKAAAAVQILNSMSPISHGLLRCVAERFHISSLYVSHAQRINVLTLDSKCSYSVVYLPCSGSARDQLLWVQMASDERHMGLTSTSDEHQKALNWIR